MRWCTTTTCTLDKCKVMAIDSGRHGEYRLYYYDYCSKEEDREASHTPSVVQWRQVGALKLVGAQTGK